MNLTAWYSPSDCAVLVDTKVRNEESNMTKHRPLWMFIARTSLIMGFASWLLLASGIIALPSSQVQAADVLRANAADQRKIQPAGLDPSNKPPREVLANAFQLQAPERLQAGESFTVDILANIATPAYGFGFRLKYDPAFVQIVSQTDLDQAQVSLLLGDLFHNAQRVRNIQQTEEAAAFVDAIYTLIPPAIASQGIGKVGSVKFMALKDGPTQIELVKPRLIGINGGQATEIPLNHLASLNLPLSITSNTVPVVAATSGLVPDVVLTKGFDQMPLLLISIIMAVVIIALAAINIIIIMLMMRLSRTTQKQLKQFEVRQKFAHQQAQLRAQAAFIATRR